MSEDTMITPSPELTKDSKTRVKYLLFRWTANGWNLITHGYPTLEDANATFDLIKANEKPIPKLRILSVTETLEREG